MRDAKGILYDMTEFVRSPLRTGIQRVSFEIIRHWHGQRPLIPVHIDERSRLNLLPSAFLSTMTKFFHDRDRSDRNTSEQLMNMGRRPYKRVSRSAIDSFDGILNPELFFCQPRIQFYEETLRETNLPMFFVIYDFLPQLQPEFFRRGTILTTLPYVRLVRQIEHVSFISESTRDAYRRRILRDLTRNGPVIPLGSDSFEIDHRPRKTNSRRFSVIGTIEPRKRQEIVLDAFESLWKNGSDAELMFVSRRESENHAFLERLKKHQRQEPRFDWVTDLTDQQVKQVIRDSRATIFVSAAEGFGLPPLESLALGVPVIVSASIPSIEMIDSMGQIRLPNPDAESIRRAVLEMLDEGFYQRKCGEIANLVLPTWAGLGRSVSDWVELAVAA